jgi:hypothetical protein
MFAPNIIPTASPAIGASQRANPADAGPMIKLAVETMLSSAPSAAVLSHPLL